MDYKKPGSVIILYVLSIMGSCNSVLMPSEEEFSDEGANYGFSYAFQRCMRTESGSAIGNVLPCLNKGALAGLIDADERECVELAHGVTLLRDMNDKSPRTIVPLDRDPTDYRSVLETTAGLIGQRSLRWDMSVIHPGLFLKVGPTLNGAGVLEFVMERGYPTYNDRTAGTGRLILRQIILPILLGFKLKLITLLPLLIGVLILVSKKALLLSKIAVFATTVMGVNSLFFLQQQQQHHHQTPQVQLQNTFGDSFLSLDPQTLAYHNKDNNQQPYSGHLDELREPIYRERDRTSDVMEPKSRRNFVWEEKDKARLDS